MNNTIDSGEKNELIPKCYNPPPPTHTAPTFVNRQSRRSILFESSYFYFGACKPVSVLWWVSPVSCQSNGGMTNDTPTVTLDSLLTLIRIMLRYSYSGITRAAVRTRVLKRKEKP